MNLESNSSKKPNMIVATDDIDFDFKPITSGLGFHNTQTTEIKPNFNQTPSVSLHQVSVPMPVSKPAPMARKDNQIYQNELSAFYGRDTATNTPVEIPSYTEFVTDSVWMRDQLMASYGIPASLMNHKFLYKDGIVASK